MEDDHGMFSRYPRFLGALRSLGDEATGIASGEVLGVVFVSAGGVAIGVDNPIVRLLAVIAAVATFVEFMFWLNGLGGVVGTFAG